MYKKIKELQLWTFTKDHIFQFVIFQQKIYFLPHQLWKNLGVQHIIKQRRNFLADKHVREVVKIVHEGVKNFREVVKNVRENIPLWPDDLL